MSLTLSSRNLQGTFTLLILSLSLSVTAVIALGCSARKMPKPSPAVSGQNKQKTTPLGAQPIQTDCVNGYPRNQNGVCQKAQKCPKMCTWDYVANPQERCWTYMTQNEVVGYSTQTVNGLPCLWDKTPRHRPNFLKGSQ